MSQNSKWCTVKFENESSVALKIVTCNVTSLGSRSFLTAIAVTKKQIEIGIEKYKMKINKKRQNNKAKRQRWL